MLWLSDTTPLFKPIRRACCRGKFPPRCAARTRCVLAVAATTSVGVLPAAPLNRHLQCRAKAARQHPEPLSRPGPACGGPPASPRSLALPLQQTAAPASVAAFTSPPAASSRAGSLQRRPPAPRTPRPTGSRQSAAGKPGPPIWQALWQPEVPAEPRSEPASPPARLPVDPYKPHDIKVNPFLASGLHHNWSQLVCSEGLNRRTGWITLTTRETNRLRPGSGQAGLV